MAKFGWAMALGGLLCAGAHGAAVGGQPHPLDISITTNYYFFGGTNHALMRAAMVAARPWHQSMAWDADTKWSIQSHYHYARDNMQFKLGAIHVRTVVRMTLPWWAPRGPASPQLWTEWQASFKGLKTHEQGHVDLAIAAGTEVQHRLEALPAFATLQELRANADRTIKETIDTFRQRDRQYDETTHHGQTQGAFFGWRDHPRARPIYAGSHTNGFYWRQSRPGS